MTERNVVRVIPCASWEDFTRRVRQAEFMTSRVFRGQRTVKWRLESQWERWLRSLKDQPEVLSLLGSRTELLRDSYIENFKHLMRGLGAPLSPTDPDREWWALGRQHGLLTPLLDWTRSPYVAAYFAFMDYADSRNPGFRLGAWHGAILSQASRALPVEPIAVWELYTDEELLKPGDLQFFSSRGQATARRELAQQGCFTWLTHDTDLDVESYLKSRGKAQLLGRYEIAGGAMIEALWDTHLMNINEATLYPDADGAARQANMGNKLSVQGGVVLALQRGSFGFLTPESGSVSKRGNDKESEE